MKARLCYELQNKPLEENKYQLIYKMVIGHKVKSKKSKAISVTGLGGR
jgi:hypothetical protein